MKTTFTVYKPSGIVTTAGRPQLVAGKSIEVSRLDIHAFIPENPQQMPLTNFHLWLTNGEQYHIVVPAVAEPIPGRNNASTDDKTIREGT